MKDDLKPYDLVATWLQVRVLPLQRRVHQICDMATWRDPTRICTRKMNFEELCARVKALTNNKLSDPFKSEVPAPWSQTSRGMFRLLLAFIRLSYTSIQLLFFLTLFFL